MVEARMLTMTKLSSYYKIKYVKTEEHRLMRLTLFLKDEAAGDRTGCKQAMIHFTRLIKTIEDWEM